VKNTLLYTWREQKFFQEGALITSTKIVCKNIKMSTSKDGKPGDGKYSHDALLQMPMAIYKLWSPFKTLQEILNGPTY
jgi:hypothetical protein